MKKILLCVFLFIFSISLFACEPQEKYDGTYNPFIQTETNYQSISLDKKVYNLADEINVSVFGAQSQDYVGIYDMKGEPGVGGDGETDITLHKQRIGVEGKDKVTFQISRMKLEPGEYCACLFNMKTSFLYDRVTFKVSDGDKNNYQVTSASFNFTNESEYRTSSITITPSTTKELTYTFYWANNGVRLEKYSALGKVKKASSESFEFKLKDNMYMPREANQIEVDVFEGTSIPYFINVDNSFKLAKSKYLFNFQVFSDIHSDPSQYTWKSHFETSLIDVMRLSGNSSGIFAVGDVTNFGNDTNFIQFNDVIEKYLKNGPKVYVALGNHEYQYHDKKTFDYATNLFYQFTENENIYYTVEINGCKFIVLGSESFDKAGYMSEEQLNWFTNEMSKVDKNKPTFVFFHQPLGNTTSGTYSGLETPGFRNVDTELREVLKEHPNTYVFAGHTHITYESENTALFGKGEDANFVNTGSIAYLNDTSYRVIVGSMGLFVEVYEDYIMINGRNFYTGQWVSEGMFVSPLYSVN